MEVPAHRIETFLKDFLEKLDLYKRARDRYLTTYRKDPLASLLIDRFRFSPYEAGLFGFAIVFLTYAIGYALRFLLHQEIGGITKTGLDIVYDFCLVPLVFGYYHWVSTKPSFVFLKLQENGISFSGKEEYEKFALRAADNIINNRWVHILSFIGALCMACLTIYSAATGAETWGPRDANYLVFYFLKVPVTWGISWYMVCIIFIKETLTVWTFRRLMKNHDLQINMFHKDKCAGLKPISDYLMTFMYFLMACCFGFVLLVARSAKFGYFRHDYIVNFSLLVYLALAGFYFFFPLHPGHKLLKKLGTEIRLSPDMKGFLPNWPLTPVMARRYALATAAPLVLFFLVNWIK